MSRPIRGIFPAIFTPMHSDGQVNHDGLKQLVNELFTAKVHGLYVGGSTGEGILLSSQERQAVLESVVEATQGRGGVMVHIGAVSTREAIDLAQHAKSAGADAISAVPPFAFGKNKPAILVHYRALAEACDLPLYLYNIPSLTGVHVTADLILELAKLPSVVGMKFSDHNLFTQYHIIRNTPSFDVFHGADETLLYGLMSGAVGGIGLTYNYAPALYVKIFELFEQGKFEQANKLQQVASRLIDLFVKYGGENPIGFGKALLSKFSAVDAGPARLPNPAPCKEQLAKLVDELKAESLMDAGKQTFLEELT